MNNTLSAVLAIVGGVIGLATLSVILAPRAQTTQVLAAAGGALSGVIGAAVAPVTGTGVGGNSGGFGSYSPSDFIKPASSLFGVMI